MSNLCRPTDVSGFEDGSLLSKRVYEVKADAAGNLTRTYSVGWSTKPMDDEGRVWLARVLPQLIRDSGIGAGPRVARILRQGGPQAVLAEIGRIHSDGSKRVYLEQLFSQATLKPSDLKDSARLIRSISSDGDKAQVIITVDANYFTTDLRSYLFDCCRKHQFRRRQTQGSLRHRQERRRKLRDARERRKRREAYFVRRR